MATSRANILGLTDVLAQCLLLPSPSCASLRGVGPTTSSPASRTRNQGQRYQHDRPSGRLLHADQYATICPKALRWLLPWCFRDNERCPAGPLSH
jgi:hypothetical protein